MNDERKEPTMTPWQKFGWALIALAVLAMPLALITLSTQHSALRTPAAEAATENPSSGSAGYYVMTYHFDSQLTSTVADKAQWNMPWKSKLVAIKCSGRAFGGSASPTYTWTLQEAGGTAATCAPTTAATEVEGTITDSAIADEASMTLDYASTGTSPTADDMTVILIFKRQ
jgi:hypothetical protein